MQIHAIEDSLHDFATDIFEIDVDALRGGGDELLLPLRMFVVDGGGEAEIV